MAHNLDSFITTRYSHWVRYAAYHIRQSRLFIDPCEVVNDVLCTLLQGDTAKLEHMMNARNKDGTELDFFMMRIIKRNILSERSPFRYQRGQHCTERLGDSIRRLPAPAPDFEEEDAFTQVRQVFEHLQLPELSKRIFAWRLFDGRSFAEWPGHESQKFLYKTFNRVMSLISAKIRRRNAR